MSYLKYRNQRTSPSGKTFIWDIFNDLIPLGTIKWYAPWRKYVFYPVDGTLFDSNCLLEIVSMLNQQMKFKHEKSQTHCRYCFKMFQGDTLEELLKKVEEHENECTKKQQ